jgi:glucose uptake protein GlcU
MNFDPTIPTGVAIFMGLLAASWWGSWFISLKYLKGYPLDAFYVSLFVSSMIIVWGSGFILDGFHLLQNIHDGWVVDPSRVYITFLCGMLYVIGMQLSLRVVQVIGLSVASPIQSSINVVSGTLITALVGGIPENLSWSRIFLSGVFLLAAILLSMSAGRIRNQAQRNANIDTGLSKDPKVMVRSLWLLVVSSAFVPAYSLAISYGLKSITQPMGMAVMPFMAMLCTGAFTGAMLTCGTNLTIKKQWHVFREAGFEIHKLGMISGVAHFGGNIIHTFATRNLSAVVSWPLGLSSGLWTQVWGLAYDEFKGSPRIGYVLLILGFLSYIIGVFIISSPY